MKAAQRHKYYTKTNRIHKNDKLVKKIRQQVENSKNNNTVYGYISTTADVAFYSKSNLTPLTLYQVTTINSGPG